MSGQSPNTISGFAQGDLIDLTNVTYDGGDTYSVAGNQLTVSAGGSTNAHGQPI